MLRSLTLGVALAAALPALLTAQTAAAEGSLTLRYFGAAGWELTDGNVTVLIDPWISRLPYGGGKHPDDPRSALSRTDLAYSDTTLIDSLVTEADFILVHHGHFDHLGDVPYIAKKTGAKVIGTETTITILRAYDVPDDQLYAVRGGEDYQFEGFSVRVVPTLHSALGEKHYYDSRRFDEDSGLEAPLRINQFIEGGSLSFLARFEEHDVLTMGSMNFIEREFEGLEPDVLLAGVNGSRLGLYNYDERLLRVTGYPEVVIPTHWDNFRVPYGFSQQANIDRNIVPFTAVAARVSPGSRVIAPVHLEPIVLPPPTRALPGTRDFGPGIPLEDSAATSANVSLGDVDGDGHLDVVLVKGRHWPLVDYVLPGDGRGDFAEPYEVSPEADRSYSGVLIDLDRDGDLDIVVSNDEPDPKVVHLNDGTGRFERASTFGEPEWSTRHVAVADLDADGHPDAILANRYGGEGGPSYACFGDGRGGFASPCAVVSEGSATTITPADFDGDGFPDLVVPHRDGGQSYVYLNDGSGGFGERVPFGPGTAAIRSARATDLNGDGLMDLAYIDQRTGPAVIMGGPDMRFGAPRPLEGPEAMPYAIQVADIDENGRPDIIVGYVEARPMVHFNDGDHHFTAKPFGDAEGAAYGFAVGDLNEDGFLDIAMARSGATNVLYLGVASHQ